MATPITWQNVGINDGSNAASLGNTAANLGQNAIQGLSIFNEQLQDRINREDTLLTNNAIAQALQGGPTVSNNRRVDATLLQSAVEKDRAGIRGERALNDDLLTAAVNRRLNTASAGVREKDLSTYDERLKLDQEIARSEADYRSTQSEVARANLEELKRQKAETEKKHQAFIAIESELYSPERAQKIEADFEANWAQNAPAGATEEDKAIAKANFVESSHEQPFHNPNLIQQLAQKYGLLSDDIFQGLPVGRRVLAAQGAADAAIAERAALQDATTQSVITNATKYRNGDMTMVRYDGTDYVFEKDTAATDATFNAAFRDMQVDPKDDRAKEFRAKIESRFKSASVAEQIIKEIVRDGEIPDGFSRLVDERFNDLKQRSLNKSKAQVGVSGTGDPYADLNNYYRAINSRNPTRTEITPEGAGKITPESLESVTEAIRRINVAPANEAEVQQSKDALQLSVKGLTAAQTKVKLPEDASQELRILFNRFKNEIDVAKGGMMLPDIPGIAGLAGPGYVPRPVKPRFADKRNAAAKAVDLLQQLQVRIEQENKAAEAARLRQQLDQ